MRMVSIAPQPAGLPSTCVEALGISMVFQPRAESGKKEAVYQPAPLWK